MGFEGGHVCFRLDQLGAILSQLLQFGRRHLQLGQTLIVGAQPGHDLRLLLEAFNLSTQIGGGLLLNHHAYADSQHGDTGEAGG